MAEEFKLFLLSAPLGGNKTGTLSQNTASTYFSIFKAALKQAFIDGYLTVDLSAKIKGIQDQESRREYLSIDELNTLAATPCERMCLNAQPFSLRLQDCDIAIFKNCGGKKSTLMVIRPSCILPNKKPRALNILPFQNKRYNFVENRVHLNNLFLKICLTLPGFLVPSSNG